MPSREKCGLPLPRCAGPASVEPPSQAITCGLSEIPRSSEDSRKPEPIWPDADNTLTSVIVGFLLSFLMRYPSSCSACSTKRVSITRFKSGVPLMAPAFV